MKKINDYEFCLEELDTIRVALKQALNSESDGPWKRRFSSALKIINKIENKKIKSMFKKPKTKEK